MEGGGGTSESGPTRWLIIYIYIYIYIFLQRVTFQYIHGVTICNMCSQRRQPAMAHLIPPGPGQWALPAAARPGIIALPDAPRPEWWPPAALGPWCPGWSRRSDTRVSALLFYPGWPLYTFSVYCPRCRALPISRDAGDPRFD